MSRGFGTRRGARGFTLMELVLTISVMGILAAVVVFGAGDFGTVPGCKADAKMLRNAESSFYVTNGRYATQDELVKAGLIRTASVLHEVEVVGLSFTLTELGKCKATGSGDTDVVAGETIAATDGFSVLVAAGDGTPVADVVIAYRSGGSEWKELGTTDKTGIVNGDVAAGTYDVQATLYGATNDVLDVEVTQGTLVVLPTVGLTVSYVDSYSKPLADGSVSLRQNGSKQWYPVGVTDDTGAVAVEVLPADYDVSMGAYWTKIDPDAGVAADGISEVRSAITVNAATTIEFRATKLTVQLHDANGKPVAGATVSAGASATGQYPATATTGDDGWAVLQVLPAIYDVSVLLTDAGGATVGLADVLVGTEPVVADLVVS